MSITFIVCERCGCSLPKVMLQEHKDAHISMDNATQFPYTDEEYLRFDTRVEKDASGYPEDEIWAVIDCGDVPPGFYLNVVAPGYHYVNVNFWLATPGIKWKVDDNYEDWFFNPDTLTEEIEELMEDCPEELEDEFVTNYG